MDSFLVSFLFRHPLQTLWGWEWPNQSTFVPTFIHLSPYFDLYFCQGFKRRGIRNLRFCINTHFAIKVQVVVQDLSPTGIWNLLFCINSMLQHWPSILEGQCQSPSFQDSRHTVPLRYKNLQQTQFNSTAGVPIIDFHQLQFERVAQWPDQNKRCHGSKSNNV